MIVSFACKETEKIWQGVRSRKLPSDIQERALRKLLFIKRLSRIKARNYCKMAFKWRIFRIIHPMRMVNVILLALTLEVWLSSITKVTNKVF